MTVAHATGAARLLSPLCASALIVAIGTGYAARSDAQTTPVTPSLSARSSSSPGAEAEASELQLLVGRSTVLNIGLPIARVSLTSADVADAMVTTQHQLLVHGKAPGTISMFVWDRAGGIKRFEVIVQRDLSQLAEQMRQLFPGEAIVVTGNGKDVVIAGTVSSKYVIDKATDVAAGYVAKKEDVVNLLRQQEGIATNQVMLRVRFAEVSRSALTELGASFFTGPAGSHDWLGRTTTQQYAAPIFDEENGVPKLIFSDFLNVFLFNTKEQLGGVIRALTTKGLFQSLAEPNLIAENGKEASFLAGGEYPYPVAQGQSGNLSVTIVFKEFGIRLRFTPTVLGGDLIHLKVAPEVSALDFNNAVVANGFRIPALSTRRAETELELRDGQTFAIAGLLNNTMTSTLQKIPGIGDIPILGLLFKSKAAQKARTELVVMITPQIIRAGSIGVAPGLPNLYEPYLKDENKLPPPPPWLGTTPPGGAMSNPNPPGPMPTNLQPRLATEKPAQAPVATSKSAPSSSTSQAAKPQASKSTPPKPTASTAPAKTAPAATKASSSTSKAAQPSSAGGTKGMPEQMSTPLDQAVPSSTVKVEPTPTPAKASEAKATSVPVKKLSKEELNRQQKMREVEAKRAVEQAKLDQARAEEARKQAEKDAAEKAERDAELARKQEQEAKKLADQKAQEDKRQAELTKKQKEAQEKRGRSIAQAEAKLKAAQAEYLAELERAQKENTTPPQDKP